MPLHDRVRQGHRLTALAKAVRKVLPLFKADAELLRRLEVRANLTGRTLPSIFTVALIAILAVNDYLSRHE